MTARKIDRTEDTSRLTQGIAYRIKGNINREGDRIYHLPRNRFYEATTVNEAEGERWFCTEEEARAAGWRSARR